MNVGFVGLGSLGRQLAARVAAAGHPLVVHDRDAAAVAVLVAAGATAAPSPRAVAATADCVITCLPSSQAVSDVVAGPDGIAAGLRRGGTWIDMSTNDPHELLRLAALLAERGIATLECPVTGGVHRAAAGEITVIAGGDEAVFAAHRDLLGAIGGEIIHVGALGQASLVKVITNMLAFVNLVAVGEALMLARRGGVDLATAYDAIRASSGTSFVHETESQVILNGSYDIGFTMDLALKDLGFALALGERHGVPLELAELVTQSFTRAREAYGGGAQSSQVVKLLEDALGTDLRAPGFPSRLT
ncbi:MAG TPA: NAD(P)-dependent oxidoreductase, partial [Gaiellales bacterium]